MLASTLPLLIGIAGICSIFAGFIAWVVRRIWDGTQAIVIARESIDRLDQHHAELYGTKDNPKGLIVLVSQTDNDCRSNRNTIKRVWDRVFGPNPDATVPPILVVVEDHGARLAEAEKRIRTLWRKAGLSDDEFPATVMNATLNTGRMKMLAVQPPPSSVPPPIMRGRANTGPLKREEENPPTRGPWDTGRKGR